MRLAWLALEQVLHEIPLGFYSYYTVLLYAFQETFINSQTRDSSLQHHAVEVRNNPCWKRNHFTKWRAGSHFQAGWLADIHTLSQSDNCHKWPIHLLSCYNFAPYIFETMPLQLYISPTTPVVLCRFHWDLYHGFWDQFSTRVFNSESSKLCTTVEPEILWGSMGALPHSQYLVTPSLQRRA